MSPLFCSLIVLLASLCTGEWIRLHIEASPDISNGEAPLFFYAVSRAGNRQQLSDRKYLGELRMGSMKTHTINIWGNSDNIDCLRVSLNGTKGEALKKITMVLTNGRAFEFQERKETSYYFWEDGNEDIYFDFCDRTEKMFWGKDFKAGKEVLLEYGNGTVCSKSFDDAAAATICRQFNITEGETRWRPINQTWAGGLSVPPPIMKLGGLTRCSFAEAATLYHCDFSTVVKGCEYKDSVMLTCGVKHWLTTTVKIVLGITAALLLIATIIFIYYKLIFKCAQNSGSSSAPRDTAEWSAQPLAPVQNTAPSAPAILSTPSAPATLSAPSAPAILSAPSAPSYHQLTMDDQSGLGSDMPPPSYDEALSYRKLSQ